MATRSSYTPRRRAPSEEAILDAAVALIEEETFHTATMEDLARRAGVSRATVFSRFGTKLGVLETLSVRCAGGPEMAAIRAAEHVEDPLAALEALVGAACELWERQGFILIQLKAIVVLEPDASAAIESQWVDQHGAMEHVVRRLARAGRLRAGLSEARATATLHAVTSVETFLALRRDGALSLRQTRETVAELARTVLG